MRLYFSLSDLRAAAQRFKIYITNKIKTKSLRINNRTYTYDVDINLIFTSACAQLFHIIIKSVFTARGYGKCEQLHYYNIANVSFFFVAFIPILTIITK